MPATTAIRKRKQAYRNHVMVEVASIRYTQTSVKDTFSNGAPLSWTIYMLRCHKIKPRELPLIRIGRVNNQWRTIDNRRLYCFKQAGIVKIPAIIMKDMTYEFVYKNQSYNDGLVINLIHDPPPNIDHNQMIMAYDPETSECQRWKIITVIEQTKALNLGQSSDDHKDNHHDDDDNNKPQHHNHIQHNDSIDHPTTLLLSDHHHTISNHSNEESVHTQHDHNEDEKKEPPQQSPSHQPQQTNEDQSGKANHSSNNNNEQRPRWEYRSQSHPVRPAPYIPGSATDSVTHAQGKLVPSKQVDYSLSNSTLHNRVTGVSGPGYLPPSPHHAPLSPNQHSPPELSNHHHQLHPHALHPTHGHSTHHLPQTALQQQSQSLSLQRPTHGHYHSVPHPATAHYRTVPARQPINSYSHPPPVPNASATLPCLPHSNSNTVSATGSKYSGHRQGQTRTQTQSQTPAHSISAQLHLDQQLPQYFLSTDYPLHSMHPLVATASNSGPKRSLPAGAMHASSNPFTCIGGGHGQQHQQQHQQRQQQHNPTTNLPNLFQAYDTMEEGIEGANTEEPLPFVRRVKSDSRLMAMRKTLEHAQHHSNLDILKDLNDVDDGMEEAADDEFKFHFLESDNDNHSNLLYEDMNEICNEIFFIKAQVHQTLAALQRRFSSNQHAFFDAVDEYLKENNHCVQK